MKRNTSGFSERSQRNYGHNYLVAKKFPLWVRLPFNILFFLAMALCLAIAVLSCIFIRTPVIGPSMIPTINTSWLDGEKSDTVLINRLKKGERNDIIVIQKKTGEASSQYLIKRLIATGGDKISVYKKTESTYGIVLIEKGTTQIRDLNDPYENMSLTYTKFTHLKNSSVNTFETISGYDFLVIPNDSIFYLGDNRNSSEDCSTYGPVEAKRIIGKVVKVVPYGENVFKGCFHFFWSAVFGEKKK